MALQHLLLNNSKFCLFFADELNFYSPIPSICVSKFTNSFTKTFEQCKYAGYGEMSHSYSAELSTIDRCMCYYRIPPLVHHYIVSLWTIYIIHYSHKIFCLNFYSFICWPDFSKDPVVIPPSIFRWQMVDVSMLKVFADYLHIPLQPKYLLTFLPSFEGLSSIFLLVIPPQFLVAAKCWMHAANIFVEYLHYPLQLQSFLSFSPIFQVLRIHPSKTIGYQIVSWMHAATICGLSTKSPLFVLRHFVVGPWKWKFREHLRQEAFRPCP